MHFEKRVPLFLELGFAQDKIPDLKKYVDLLWSSNEELNLISRKMTKEDLIDNHVIDCLLPLKYFPTETKQIADFGTGGGLPGVIYAIHFADKNFHLFEKSKLKQNFLTLCKKISPNIEVKAEIPSQLKNIDLVICSAFKPIDVILDVSRSYQQGGQYFLLKARKEKIEEELLLAKKKFKELTVEIKPLSSPVLEVERNLVLIS